MDLKGLFEPDRKKLLVALVAFMVLPNFIIGEERTYCDDWYAPVVGMESEDCTTETPMAIVLFFGLTWFLLMLFDASIFFQVLPFLILHIIISYAVACLIAKYVLKPKGKK